MVDVPQVPRTTSDPAISSLDVTPLELAQSKASFRLLKVEKKLRSLEERDAARTTRSVRARSAIEQKYTSLKERS